MLAKTGLAVSIAICLTTAGAALASGRDGSSAYQARQGIGEPSHAVFTTDVSRAYALDQSSKAKKKTPKQVKPGPASTSGAASRGESEEQARERRYEENH